MPEPPPPPPPIPESDEELLAQCRVETFRSGGKGGQHQNKTETGVRLVHQPTGVSVVARRSRSQARNKAEALSRLRARLDAMRRPRRERKATRVPARERARRLEQKRRRAALKRLRRKPDPDGS